MMMCYPPPLPEYSELSEREAIILLLRLRSKCQSTTELYHALREEGCKIMRAAE
jgi:hypothetical protein